MGCVPIPPPHTHTDTHADEDTHTHTHTHTYTHTNKHAYILNGIIGTPNSHPGDMRFNAIRAKRIIFFEALLGEVVYL